MSTRDRVPLLGVAAVCLVTVAVLGLLVTQDRSPLDSLDQWGRSGEDWADGHPAVIRALRVIEVAFATVGMIIWTTTTAIVLLVRRRPRAAAMTVLVMIVTSLTTTALKLRFGRGRPDWQDDLDLLTTRSFPSGHASASAALAAILVVLVWTLVRRPGVRAAPRARAGGQRPLTLVIPRLTERSVWASIRASELAVFPKGWSGTWDFHETVRKVYAIL